MSPPRPLHPLVRALLAVVLLGWTALVFWSFSFSFSASFFEWNLPSRLPPFVSACLAGVAMPVAAVLAWLAVRRGTTSALRAWLAHGVAVAVSLGQFVLVAGLLRVLPRPWLPSADDAMGIGIDFMLLVALAVVVHGVLVLWLLTQHRWRGRARLPPERR